MLEQDSAVPDVEQIDSWRRDFEIDVLREEPYVGSMNTRVQNRSRRCAAQAPPPRRGLAVVIADLGRSRAGFYAIERAAELSAEVDLHVVGRIPARRQASGMHRRRLRDLVYEAAGLLPDHVAINAEIRSGTRYSVAVDVATELRPTLIVVGASHATGANMVAIADSLGAPVLVVRAPARSARVVAASDARLELTPVLGCARRILGNSRGAITLFHASTPTCRHTSRETIGGYAFDRATCDRLLALQQLGPCVDGVRIRVGESDDAVRAILEFADRRDVDVLAIGYRQQPRPGRERHHTTARVVDGCSCSVLIVPIARALESA